MSKGRSDSGKRRTFDWEAVRQRIAEINLAMEESVEVPQGELQRVWAHRAADLAKVSVEEDESEHIRLVLVRLGREIYGLDAQYIFTVKPADLITRVPRVPEWVAGVVNLRGRILSVVDLRRFFGLPSTERNGDDGAGYSEEGPHLVVVETPDIELALLADDVLTVESVPLNQIQDTSGTVRGLRSEYVKGVLMRKDDHTDAGDNGSMVVVLDLLNLLANERLIVHEEII